MLRPNTILNDTWEIKKRIGQGSFCELFLARNITDKDVPLVAIKAQNNEIEASIIRVEGDVIKALNGIPSVPKFYCYGQYKGKDYIVMELLGGEDMSRVRNRARAASNANLVVLPAACFLTRAMLKSVKAIHEKGYIHRDIKPANFVRRDRNSSEFCMVDFGLARGYRDKDGNIRPKKENAEFRGTALYASPFIHEGEDQCPRDDLFSLVFVFCDLVCGKLPWSEAARLKDKNGVASLKKQYLTDPRRFLEWIKVQAEEADNTKRFTEGEPNFPSHAQEQCLIIIRHLQALKYEDTPNYALIDEAFRKTVNNHDRHDVSNIAYSYGGFDWTCSSAALSTVLDEKVDHIQTQKILCARSRILGKDIQKARRLAAAHNLVNSAKNIAAMAVTPVEPVVIPELTEVVVPAVTSEITTPITPSALSSSGLSTAATSSSGVGEAATAEDALNAMFTSSSSQPESIGDEISAEDALNAMLSEGPNNGSGSGLHKESGSLNTMNIESSEIEPMGLDYDELALLLETNSPLPVPNPLDSLDICAQAIRNMNDINENLPPTDTNLSGLDIELAISDIFSSTTDIESVETCQVNPTPSINPPQIPLDTPISLEAIPCTKISNSESVKFNAEIKGAETREVNPVPVPPTTMPAARCTDFSLALIWQDIASQTLLIPESLMQKEILDALDSLLRDAGRFYSCDLGENDERWGEYMELQKVAHKFAELVSRRSNKRSRESLGRDPNSGKDTNSSRDVHNGRESYGTGNSYGSRESLGSNGHYRESGSSHSRSNSFSGSHDHKRPRIT